MAEMDDQQLIEQYLSGDDQALEFLIDKYFRPIYGFVFHYVNGGAEAEDITQDVFVKVWKNIKKFDQNKSFKTWIFTIAKNTALDWLKKKKNIPFSSFNDEEGNNVIEDTFADPGPLPDELFDRTNLADELNKAMAKLSVNTRVVLSLYYLEGFNLREISETLDEPIDTVKSRHRRGLISLRKILLAPK